MQSRFDRKPRIAYPGQKGKHKISYEPYINNTSALPQIDTLTLVLEESITYNVVINLENFSYTSVVGDADTDVRDALITAINLSGQELIAALASNDTFTVRGADGVVNIIKTDVVGATTGSLSVAPTQAAVKTAAVPIGRAIVKVDTNADDQAQLGAPDAMHKFVGVAFDSNTMLNNQPLGSPQISHQYGPGEIMAVAIRGSVWVSIEEDVTPTSDVFYRYDSSGVTGAFRATAATGCAQIISARWLNSGKAGEMAELMLGI